MSESSSKKMLLPARVLSVFALAAGVYAGPFSMRQYLQDRFHPETVRERDIEGLDQRIQDGKLTLDMKAFLTLLPCLRARSSCRQAERACRCARP